MTDREKAIVMAYTGTALLAGDKLNIFYEYLNELYHRPVYTHEIPFLDIKEKAKQDFLDLCRDDDKFKERAEIVIRQLREDNERLNELIEDIKEEISLMKGVRKSANKFLTQSRKEDPKEDNKDG